MIFFDFFCGVVFFIKALYLEMVKSTRCFSFKINDFVSIGAMRIPILCVWAPRTNGLRKGWYFQKNWKWFWQCVYRGARIKNHHCCEELRQKNAILTEEHRVVLMFFEVCFFYKKIAFENGQIDSVFFIQNQWFCKHWSNAHTNFVRLGS